MKRPWSLRFVCAHYGCKEFVNYNYETKRDMVDSFENRNYSNGQWLCLRHKNLHEVLSLDNPETRMEMINEAKETGNYFGHSGFISGPGFRVFADDIPVGTKLVVTARLFAA